MVVLMEGKNKNNKNTGCHSNDVNWPWTALLKWFPLIVYPLTCASYTFCFLYCFCWSISIHEKFSDYTLSICCFTFYICLIISLGTNCWIKQLQLQLPSILRKPPQQLLLLILDININDFWFYCATLHCRFSSKWKLLDFLFIYSIFWTNRCIACTLEPSRDISQDLHHASDMHMFLVKLYHTLQTERDKHIPRQAAALMHAHTVNMTGLLVFVLLGEEEWAEIRSWDPPVCLCLDDSNPTASHCKQMHLPLKLSAEMSSCLYKHLSIHLLFFY